MPVYGKDFNYTGDYIILDDSDSDGIKWRVKFLSSGTFTPLTNMLVDIFLCGGGGGSSGGIYAGGGGGGGYVNNNSSVALTANEDYSIVVGAAGSYTSSRDETVRGTDGGTSTAFNLSAAGGSTGYFEYSRYFHAGNGGSGGSIPTNMSYGGTDGANGTSYYTSTSSGWYYAGNGAGKTTREFGESTGDLYCSGGGLNITETIPNSGNGATPNPRYDAGSGIVIIRNHRE